MKLILLLTVMILFFYSCKEIDKKTDEQKKPIELKNSDSLTLAEPIIDCNYKFEEAVKGIEIPESIKNNLDLVNVQYYSFDNKLHQGQILINKVLTKDIETAFKEIKENNFPIARAIPIVKYNWSDSASMMDNNTSAFNYRMVKGTKVLSAHSKGNAIDVNPMLNPQFKNGKFIPISSTYNPIIPGTVTENSIVVKVFKKLGWKWGGNWIRTKDYQHFEK